MIVSFRRGRKNIKKKTHKYVQLSNNYTTITTSPVQINPESISFEKRVQRIISPFLGAMSASDLNFD